MSFFFQVQVIIYYSVIPKLVMWWKYYNDLSSQFPVLPVAPLWEFIQSQAYTFHGKSQQNPMAPLKDTATPATPLAMKVLLFNSKQHLILVPDLSLSMEPVVDWGYLLTPAIPAKWQPLPILGKEKLRSWLHSVLSLVRMVAHVICTVCSVVWHGSGYSDNCFCCWLSDYAFITLHLFMIFSFSKHSHLFIITGSKLAV